MAAIENLSSELLIDVMSYLDKEEWVSLTRTSKSLRGCAERCLYRHIEIPTRGPKGHAESDPIYPLFMTLWKSPQLAKLVHELDLRYDDRRMRDIRTRFNVNQASLDKARSQALQQLQVSETLTAKVKNSIQSGGNHATLALTISLCTRLTRIDLDLSLFDKSPLLLLAALTPRANPNPTATQYSGLRNLQVFRLWNNEGVNAVVHYRRESLYWALASDLSRLPSLQTLQLVVPSSTMYPAEKMPSICLSHVKRLQMIDLGTSKEKLAVLLRGVPKLQRLEHFRAMDTDMILDHTDEDTSYIGLWSGLQEALAGKERQLQDLVITLGYVNTRDGYPFNDLRFAIGGWRGEVWHRMGHMDGLQKFESLQCLEIPIIALLGWHRQADFGLTEALPPNLKHLTLRTDCCNWPASAYEWVDGSKNYDASAIYDLLVKYLLTPDGNPIARPLKTLCFRIRYDQRWGGLCHYDIGLSELGKKTSIDISVRGSSEIELQAHEDQGRAAPVETTSQLVDYMYTERYSDY